MWDGRRSGWWGYTWHVSCDLRGEVTALGMGLLTLVLLAAEVDTLLSGRDIFRLDTTGWHPLTGVRLVTLGYAALVLGWATTHLLAGRENLLVAGRRTSSLTLSFYAQSALGLSAPLLFYALEFLFPTMRKSGDDDDPSYGPGARTAFFKAYGTRVQQFGGAGMFSLFFPLLMVIFVFLQACGIYNRLLSCTGLSWLSFDAGVVVSDEAHPDIALGKRLLKKKREAVAVDVKYKRSQNQRLNNNNPSMDKDALWRPKPPPRQHSSCLGCLFSGGGGGSGGQWNEQGLLREPLIGGGGGGGGTNPYSGDAEAGVGGAYDDIWDDHAARISEDNRRYANEGGDDDDDDNDNGDGRLRPGWGGSGRARSRGRRAARTPETARATRRWRRGGGGCGGCGDDGRAAAGVGHRSTQQLLQLRRRRRWTSKQREARVGPPGGGESPLRRKRATGRRKQSAAAVGKAKAKAGTMETTTAMATATTAPEPWIR